MSDCPREGMRDLLPDLVNGTLAPGVRASVEQHVAGCAVCASELALLRSLQASISRMPKIDTARVAAAVRQATREASGPPRSAVVGSISRPATGRWWAIGIAAAAAAVLAAGYFFAHPSPARGPAVPVAVAPSAAPSAPSAPSAPTVTPAPPPRFARADTPKTTSPHESVAVPRAVRASSTGVALEGGLSDLTDDDLRSLLDAASEIQALPSVEPAPVLDTDVGEGDS